VRLREVADLAGGTALVFDWTDATPVGRQYDRRHELASMPTASRVAAVQQIYDFAAQTAARGWVAIDLYDGSVMIDLHTGRVTLCDLDVYRRAPVVNDMGRMWGSSRFMSPEEYRLGAEIDEVSTVVTLGAFAHTFLGDDATRDPTAWTGTPEQLAIATRALDPDRTRRWPSIAALAQAWRTTSGIASARE
jgi:serine/threonine protein kinase, bacterial